MCIKILKTFPWTYALPLNSVLFWIAFCYSLHIHECSVCVLQVLHSGIPGTEILCYIVEKRQSSIFIHRPHNSISLSGHDIVNFLTHLANIWPVLLIPSKAFLCNSFFTSFIDISNYLQHLFFPIFVWYIFLSSTKGLQVCLVQHYRNPGSVQIYKQPQLTVEKVVSTKVSKVFVGSHWSIESKTEETH